MDWEQYLKTLFATSAKTEAVEFLCKQPDEIVTLMGYISHTNEKLAWRAAWILDHLNQKDPLLLRTHLETICELLKKTSFNGVRRSLIKILITNPSKVNEDGTLVDLCFRWITDPGIPTAVRVHSMQMIFDLLPYYPDLRGEFKSCLEMTAHEEGKGIKSRTRKLLLRL